MSFKPKDDIPLDHIHSILGFDEDGDLFWKVDVARNVKAGSKAGRINNCGYLTVTINRSNYVAHRIIWAMFYGKWPNGMLDHINGIRTDNRLCNLREVTNAENMQNRRSASNGSRSGKLGVTEAGDKWRATIHKDKKKIHLGIFSTKDEADVAYISAKRILHQTCSI